MNVGDELTLDGVVWRVTQVIGDPVHTAYAGPVECCPRCGSWLCGYVRYDRLIHDLDAWRAEYVRQHGGY